MTPSQAGTPRFAAIDIGTNSVLLLVVEAREGRLVPVWDQAVIATPSLTRGHMTGVIAATTRFGARSTA